MLIVELSISGRRIDEAIVRVLCDLCECRGIWKICLPTDSPTCKTTKWKEWCELHIGLWDRYRSRPSNGALVAVEAKYFDIEIKSSED